MTFTAILLSFFPLLGPVLALLLAAAVGWTLRLRRTRPARGGVGGWLALLIGCLFVGPLFDLAAWLLVLGVNRPSPESAAGANYTTLWFLGIGSALLVWGLCAWAGWGLWKTRTAAVVRRAVIVLWVSGPVLFTLAGIALPLALLGGLTSAGELVGPAVTLGLHVAAALAWTLYLRFSQRVGRTYGATTPQMPQAAPPSVQSEKAEFMRTHAAPVHAIPQTIPDELMARWRTLLADPSRVASPAPPLADEAALAAFNAETGLDMPAALQAILASNDGVKDFFGHEFLSAEGILDAWKNWKLIFDDWTLEDLMGNSESDGDRTLGIYTLPLWIPFIHDGGGNFIAIDLAPGPGGVAGQVIAMGRDETKVRRLAPDLSDFLAQLIDRRRENAFSYD